MQRATGAVAPCVVSTKRSRNDRKVAAAAAAIVAANEDLQLKNQKLEHELEQLKKAATAPAAAAPAVAPVPAPAAPAVAPVPDPAAPAPHLALVLCQMQGCYEQNKAQAVFEHKSRARNVMQVCEGCKRYLDGEWVEPPPPAITGLCKMSGCCDPEALAVENYKSRKGGITPACSQCILYQKGLKAALL